MHHAALGAIHQAGEAMAAKVLAGGKLYPWSGRDEFFIEATNTAWCAQKLCRYCMQNYGHAWLSHLHYHGLFEPAVASC